jgi:hypothetical protein
MQIVLDASMNPAGISRDHDNGRIPVSGRENASAFAIRRTISTRVGVEGGRIDS